ncbi:MAG: hypothetical protein ACRC2R_14310 [Xenococcaceae cyanobacterium]
MYAYLFTALRHNLSKICSENEIFQYAENDNFVIGGSFSQASLSKLFTIVVGDRLTLIKTKIPTKIGESIYQIDFHFCSRLTNIKQEQLLDIASQWSECNNWNGKEINSMDLAGFLIEFADLCRYGIEQNREVYILFINY